MPDIRKDLLAVLAKHGLDRIPEDLSAELLRKPTLPSDIGPRASWIKEIITDSSAFDEKILAKVGEALRTFNR